MEHYFLLWQPFFMPCIMYALFLILYHYRTTRYAFFLKRAISDLTASEGASRLFLQWQGRLYLMCVASWVFFVGFFISDICLLWFTWEWRMKAFLWSNLSLLWVFSSLSLLLNRTFASPEFCFTTDAFIAQVFSFVVWTKYICAGYLSVFVLNCHLSSVCYSVLRLQY